ncbi:MAG: tRNA uridine-5-carboxymethylaminomethyl(34) synthesis GTPase MnmE [Gallionellaceae bacterium]
MLSKFDNIAAIATAPGRGGIGVVRISGRELSKFFISLLGQEIQPRHASFTPFLDAEGSAIDQGIALYFPAPNSYTGEDVLELQGHGGTAVLKLLLQRCLALGVRLAQPGEFTQRAFLNNKIDLIQAESIADLINSTSEQAVRSANRSLQGEFSKVIHQLVEKLIELRMLVESALDFPEEELDVEDASSNIAKLKHIQTELDRIFKLAKQGSILREGAHIVLVGEPNVGKSSLLNKLSGDDIALVSEIAGTTRDAIRQEISIDGVPLHIIDTAGLRESDDLVEQMGMDRTKAAIQKADAVLLLLDARQKDFQFASSLLTTLPGNIPRIFVINKIDLVEQNSRVEIQDNQVYIYLSVKQDDGIDLLRENILKLINWQGESGVYLARERHLQALSKAAASLHNARHEAHRPELFAEELRLSQLALSEITGEFSSDDLLGEIFSRFCIGK